MIVRDATPEDAVAACEVMRASMISDLYASLLVPVDGELILAVGAVKNDGEITLNYVSPEARFRGVSTALLNALEARAAEHGNLRCKLVSTETAHRFYLARGYADIGAPEGRFGTSSSYPMAKKIQV